MFSNNFDPLGKMSDSVIVGFDEDGQIDDALRLSTGEMDVDSIFIQYEYTTPGEELVQVVRACSLK